jgi:flagellar hook-basal body complex protein FliE
MSATIQGLGPQVNAFDVGTSSTNSSGKSSDFAQTLRDGMRQIEQMQTDAQQKTESVLAGNGQDLHSAMIAVQKAELSFQLMMQVRNKIVQAYQDVSKMAF